jgi:protoporphyrin/coproporphyrin ferrochelatase
MNTKGVLLINLGSPDSPSVPDVRRYLREFLMDGRVLDAPWPIRFFVVHGLILPFRPRQSAEAYHMVWLPEGSPLIVTSGKVQARLQQRVNLPVELAMRYQQPSVPSALGKLVAQGVEDCLVIPLFPHYAMSSYETAVEHVRAVARRDFPGLRLRVEAPYYQRPDYIAALAAVARPFLEREHDHLLFSFHGIPERHLRKSDPTGSHCLRNTDCCTTASPARDTCYRAQCLATMRALVRETGVTRYSVAFQSRLGRDPWLTPYTDRELERLAREGTKRLVVICPAFVADCLETLEEMGLRGRASFLNAGGREFHLIPCLNEHPAWIESLAGMVLAFAPESSAAPSVAGLPQSG